MTKAFKCDRCGEFEKGGPYRLVKTMKCLSYREERWNLMKTYELCEKCFHELMNFMGDSE